MNGLAGRHGHLQPADAHGGRRQDADRSRAEHGGAPGSPAHAALDAEGLLQALLGDGHGLDQHRHGTQARRHRDDVLGVLDVAFGHEAVQALDAALEVMAGQAHVVLAGAARQALIRAGPPHGRDHQIARRQGRSAWRRFDEAEVLVPEHQVRAAGRRFAVQPASDLGIGAAEPALQHLHHDLSCARLHIGDVEDTKAVPRAGPHRDGLHATDPFLLTGPFQDHEC